MTESADRSDRRPSPDALLAAAERDGRGRLKIFLGAAPGVGKTYAMLEAAHRLKKEGLDVVIGVIETHGRSETEALVAGLDLMPRRSADYRGQRFAEFDLDAALARKPRLILVDELAHSNIPGARHPKRYQDVEELLAAASTSIRRSTSSISKASTTWSPRSRGCACARRCPTRFSSEPTRSSWSISRRKT